MHRLPFCPSSHCSYPPLPYRHRNRDTPTSVLYKYLPSTLSSPFNGQTELSLLRRYTRAGRMRNARSLFDEMLVPTPAAWAILISGYALHGPADEAISIFRRLLDAGLLPDPFHISIILRICSALCRPIHGKELHCFSLKRSYLDDLFVANGLVTMYANCGFLRYSRCVFRGIRNPDLVSCTSMLAGLVNSGHEDEALWLLEEMAWDGIEFDAYVFSTVLKASASLKCIDSGMQIHCCLVKNGLCSHYFLGNSLLEFYSRVGELGLMKTHFNGMIERDVVTWNTMISCYACNLFNKEALFLFHEMIRTGPLCDDFTLGSILRAVTSQGALNHGREIHGFVVRSGFEFNCHVNSALLDMYIKCSNFPIPIKLFIYLQSVEAKPDVYIIASILKFCTAQKDSETGKSIHSYILKQGMNSDPFVMISLIDMYAKCGLIGSSLSVFAGITEPSPISWSAIIAGCCFNGHFREALKLFRSMQFQRIKANEFTYTSVLLSCLEDQKFRSGKEIHCNIIRNGYEFHASVISTLINFYTGLREPYKAVSLIALTQSGDSSWTSLIHAFAMIDDYKKVLESFRMTQISHGKLDHLSASYVLDSCVNPEFHNAGTQAHAYIIKRGLVSETITNNSLINMYSRCGTISDAGRAFDQISKKNSASWTSIISANTSHGRPSKALRQFRRMIMNEKHPDCDTFFSVLEACRQMGLVDEAFRHFVSMIEVYKIKPSIEIYSSMVEVLRCAGMIREAEHFMETVVPSDSNSLAMENYSVFL